jgi:Ca2+/H+ antiporter
VYTLVLLGLTTFTIPPLCLPANHVWLVHGIVLIASFAIYIVSVGWAINTGTLTAPEGSDSDDSAGSDDTSDSESISPRINSDPQPNQTFNPISSTTPLLPPQSRRPKTLRYHISYLLLGFAAICLAGYVLSHAASTIIDEFKISDVLFGVVILSVATTLPEKFIAVMSGRRGNAGILVANTAGSNIFLLALCLGVVILETKGNFPRGNVGALELGFLWGSTVALTATVWFGARFGRWIGGAMVVAYIAFVVLEFAVHLHTVPEHKFVHTTY